MSTEHRIVLVYGNFNDPATKQNFFMIRIPEGRVPWSKKIAPALDRMIRGWYTPEQHAANRAYKQRHGYSDHHWNVEGQDPEYWNASMCSRYDWNGEQFVEQERGLGPQNGSKSSEPR